MSKNVRVAIYGREIRFNMVIPKRYVLEFICSFRKTFGDITTENPQPVDDGRYCDTYGWHVQVTICETEENSFYDFVKRFCQRRNLSFRDPRE